MVRRENLFDIDIPFPKTYEMPTFEELARVKKEKTTKNKSKQTQKNKSKLTPTQKNKIKNLVGQCEMPGCKNHPHEVHHIKFLEDGGTDSYSNLIVLCGACHNDAHGKNPTGKKIPQPKFKTIVRNRSKTKADGIKEILKNVGKRSGGRKSDENKTNQSNDPWDFGFRF